MTRARLALLWLGSFAFFFSFFQLVPTFPLYAQHLGLGSGTIGVVTAAFAVASMALRGWAGWAADRYGRRPLMLVGGAVFMAAPVAYAAAAGALSLFFARLAHGAGMGLMPTAAVAMVADVAPPARRAEVLGLFGMASGLALALGPGAGVLVARALGFPALFAITAGIGALGLACIALVPESLTVRETRRFRLAETMSRTALFPSTLMLALSLTYGALISFLPLHADARGLNPGVFFLAYALTLSVVRQPAGRLSDRRGRAVGTLYTALELGIAIGSGAAGFSVARLGFTATFVAAAGIALAAAALAATRVGRA